MRSPNKRAREKLRGAVHRLAVGEGDVRSRLVSAHWLLKQLSARDLPAELHEPWRLIMSELTKRGPVVGADGELWTPACKNTMSRIRNSTGRQIAEKIYSLHTDIEYLQTK